MADEPEYAFSGDYDSKLDPYYSAVGRLVLDWAEFEFNVNDAIWELANIERKVGTCLTSQFIGPGPRFRCLVALLNFRGTPTDIVKKSMPFRQRRRIWRANEIAICTTPWYGTGKTARSIEWRQRRIEP